MKNEYKNKNIIGCDETGVGDYLTPLVACAVFITYENAQKLEEIGVTDSKKLSNTKIWELAKKIKKMAKWEVEYLNQETYNKLNQNLNANELKMLLHIKAINKIEKDYKNKIDLIIIDQFSTEKSINKYTNKLLEDKDFKLKTLKNKLKLVTKGELEHTSVAAASILAKEKFLILMHEQNNKWNEKFPLGTNENVKEFIKTFVKKNGIDNLEKVAKIKFKTTKELFGEQID